jgi:hypothetical protein
VDDIEVPHHRPVRTVDHQPECHRLARDGMGRIGRHDQLRPRLRRAMLVCMSTVLMLVMVVILTVVLVDHVMLLVLGSAAERGCKNAECQ